MLIEPVERNPELLKTIKIPKNLHYLTDVLPKPNYQPLKTRSIDRENYIKSLMMNASKAIKKNRNSKYSRQ